jgi:hypothetical protein
MNNGLIELVASSPPDDEWILVEASSSMDAYEFGEADGPGPPMTEKMATQWYSMKGFDQNKMRGFDQNKATKETVK